MASHNSVVGANSIGVGPGGIGVGNIGGYSTSVGGAAIAGCPSRTISGNNNYELTEFDTKAPTYRYFSINYIYDYYMNCESI